MNKKPNDVRVSRELKCWSCKAVFTLSEHGNCDGCCWKCGVEIDLDEMDFQQADQQGEPDVVYQWRPVNKDSGEPWLSGLWHNCGEGEYHRMLSHSETPTFKYAVRRLLAEQPATAKVDERLVEATAFVQKLRDAAVGQPSVATGYLSDILDVLQGFAKPNASHS